MYHLCYDRWVVCSYGLFTAFPAAYPVSYYILLNVFEESVTCLWVVRYADCGTVRGEQTIYSIKYNEGLPE